MATTTEVVTEERGLLSYVETLLNSYPDPITQAELAERTGKSPPAVSKLIIRIKPICDEQILIYQKKLLVKRDQETLSRIFTVFWEHGVPHRILRSRYFRHLVKQLGIHEVFVAGFPAYARYFDKEDTDAIVEIILDNVAELSFGPVDEILTRMRNERVQAYIFSPDFGVAINKLTEGIKLPLRNEKSLRSTLRLRDKFFWLVRELLVQVARDSKILKTLDSQTKRTYEDVYERTIDFYLREAFNQITAYIEETCKGKGIRFPQEHRRLGSLFTPGMAQ